MLTSYVARWRHSRGSTPDGRTSTCPQGTHLGWMIQPPNQSPYPTCRVRKRENTDPRRLRLLNPALAAGRTTLDAINVLCAARTPRSRFLLAGLRQGTRPRQTASHNTEGTRGTTALWPGRVLLVSATDLFSREPVGLPVPKHEAFAFPTDSTPLIRTPLPVATMKGRDSVE